MTASSFEERTSRLALLPHTSRKMTTGAESKPLVIGHRGASGLAPENTLTAFRLALELGADGLEFDVQLASDGRAVVIHDLRLKRTTGRAGLVSRMPSSELCELDAEAWFARKLSRPRLQAEASAAVSSLTVRGGEINRIPTLSGVLEFISRTRAKRVFVELKGREHNHLLLGQVVEQIRSFGLQNVARVISFDHSLIEYCSRNATDVRTGALFSLGTRTAVTPKSILRQLERIGARDAALHFGLISPRLVDALHEQGITVAAWTINSKIMMRRIMASDVDAIMTNFPNRLISVLEERPRPSRFRERLRRRRLRSSQGKKR